MFALAVTTGCSGCVLTSGIEQDVIQSLPSEKLVERDQLKIHSDFRIPRNHRLLDELVAQRSEIARRLGVAKSEQPIHVYVFENEFVYYSYLRQSHPGFPQRRAFFLKSDKLLNVFAYWGERVAEDLRHEVTHGYIHSVIPEIPLWIDEGIAEYFEVPMQRQGLNLSHVDLLWSLYERGNWKPNLRNLESKTHTAELSQIDYAESWLWVHFMLETDPKLVYVLRQYLKEVAENGESEALSIAMDQIDPNMNLRLVEHLELIQRESD